MMNHYDNILIVKRLKATTGNRQSYIATATADAHLQPLGKNGQQLQDGVFGSFYVAYVEADVCVSKGDRVEDEEGNAYEVSEILRHDFGAFPYKELVLKTSKRT